MPDHNDPICFHVTNADNFIKKIGKNFTMDDDCRIVSKNTLDLQSTYTNRGNCLETGEFFYDKRVILDTDVNGSNDYPIDYVQTAVAEWEKRERN